MSHRREASVPSSPVGDGNFKRSLEINMAALVGSAIGNMSISPWNRDVVLAARKGLYIIDLEAPLNLPRFLPQGGTWDVADVQWNPHTANIQYIVSTSSEKLLIWNILLSSNSSIEHILRAHYRAITDINWHPADPDCVVSTGLDSWLWAWDIRTPRRAVLGLCAFNAGGTQVKWNRQDGNMLASSHLNEVLIWDRRKGSLPVSRIKAHNSKIYGIDWAHNNRNQIVTCSLDKTIKFWDLNNLSGDSGEYEPTATVQTAYPVWRARNLPFGQGVLSLPQRGQTALEMWNPAVSNEPVERFEGHSDVVKEFVWRRGSHGNDSFQLITWSKDRTLRFWPVDTEVMQKAGDSTIHAPYVAPPDQNISFSNPPPSSDTAPALTVPVRGILGEVRASQPLRPRPSAGRFLSDPLRTHGTHGASAPSANTSSGQGEGLTRRGVVGRSAQITALSWLSSVKVGGARDGSSGAGSGGDSGNVSRLNSASRPPSIFDIPQGLDENETDDEVPQSLQEEITSVVNKLASSKVRLEKADFGKRRSCTFGLHGPWGDSTSVFIRVTFTFPHTYPQAAHPLGTPHVDLEMNPLISMKNRVLITRRLRSIRERERPCLEACLRFLLFGDQDHYAIPRTMIIDSESSSDDEPYPVTRRPKDPSHSALRGDKNLAEPRTSQGTFGPNGQLVCFFRAPPRIVKHATRDLSMSPSIGSRGPDNAPHIFRSPVLLSDAIRRLSLAAQDRDSSYSDHRRVEDTNSILRIMTNLYTFSHPKTRKFSEQSRPQEDAPTPYSLLPTRRSLVYIRDASAYIGIDIAAAGEYVYAMTHPLDWCKKNAEIAKARGRVDHERLFTMLHVLIVDARNEGEGVPTAFGIYSPLMFKLLEKMYAEFLARKDAQILVMMAVVLLRLTRQHEHLSELPKLTPPSQISHIDYFSFVRRQMNKRDPPLPSWTHHSPSPTSRSPAPVLSPSSSRGSWSSLFRPSNMRRHISTENTKEEETANRPVSAVPIPVGRAHPSSPQIRTFKKDSPLFQTAVSNSWSDALGSSAKTNISFSSAGHGRSRRPTFSQVVSSTPSPSGQKRIVFNADPKMTMQKFPSFQLQARLQRQLACHILTYAEMLSAWQFPSKRIELIKSVEDELQSILSESLQSIVLDCSPLGVVRLCSKCKHENTFLTDFCAMCNNRLSADRCSVCRLPIKGLAQTCMLCHHDSHVRCWTDCKGVLCATGCGCTCKMTISPEEIILEVERGRRLSASASEIT
ncbi:unnamed protein product [Somion occarium]